MGIILNDVIKKYKKEDGKENVVLNGISLKIEEGEMVAIKGKSGAGKSTLLHIIGMMDTMSKGKYELDGEDISISDNKKMASLRNEKIGFILQDFGLVEEETVLYNVMLAMMFGKIPLKQMRGKALRQLEEIGILHLAERKTAVLSGGEKQRVAIARALINNPKYILADEPTGALDTKTANEIIALLCELNQMGKTLIIVTHDDKVADSCKKVLFMEDGVISEKWS